MIIQYLKVFETNFLVVLLCNNRKKPRGDKNIIYSRDKLSLDS